MLLDTTYTRIQAHGDSVLSLDAPTSSFLRAIEHPPPIGRIATSLFPPVQTSIFCQLVFCFFRLTFTRSPFSGQVRFIAVSRDEAIFHIFPPKQAFTCCYLGLDQCSLRADLRPQISVSLTLDDPDQRQITADHMRSDHLSLSLSTLVKYIYIYILLLSWRFQGRK